MDNDGNVTLSWEAQAQQAIVEMDEAAKHLTNIVARLSYAAEHAVSRRDIRALEEESTRTELLRQALARGADNLRHLPGLEPLP